MVERIKKMPVLFRSGSQFRYSGCIAVTAPIPFEDMPKPVQQLFNNLGTRVTRVIVEHKDLNSDEDSPTCGFVWIYEKQKEQDNASS